MKKFSSALALIMGVITSLSFAAETESYYDAGTGKLILPHVKLGNQIYYVSMSQVGPGLTFKVDGDALFDITPTGEAGNVQQTDLHGTWLVEGSSAEELYLKFETDGTYEVFQGQAEDDNCPAGLESGTYSWEISTGLFIPSVEVDENGECGLSHPRGVDLFFVDGDRLNVRETGPDGEEFSFVRQ